MNLPNKLTLSRIILTFVFMFLLFCHGAWPKVWALFCFLLATLTDYLDGKIARQQNLVTNFGKLMDPVADKILVMGAFFSFLSLKLIEPWMLVFIVSRELLITGLRIFALGKGVTLAADVGGKHKTVSQFVAIFSIMLFLILKDILKDIWSPQLEVWSRRGIFYLMVLVITMTLISGISYLWRNRDLLLNLQQNNA
jgi:CDP-diacylglycerol--glycerol-3-phosphate 3-phosphatidyltransferase